MSRAIAQGHSRFSTAVETASASFNGVLAWIVVLFLLLTASACFSVWANVRIYHLGYLVNSERGAIQNVVSERNKLKVELNLLRSPERIGSLAGAKLGLALPTPKKVVVLKGGKFAQMKEGWRDRRLLVVAGALAACLLAIAARASQLQVILAPQLQTKALEQSYKIEMVKPRRGDILARDGSELAVSVDVDSIYAVPSNVEDPIGAAEKLARVLKQKPRVLRKKLKSNLPFVFLARQIPPDLTAAVLALKIDGVGSIKESRRYYPNSRLAGHLLGFVGSDSKGLEGLELFYDEVLKGKGEVRVVLDRDARGRTMLTNLPVSDPSTAGDSIMLTIDPALQYIAEEELDKVYREKEARGGIAAIMDPHTGEILALAIRPGFDPNNFKRFTAESWRDRAVTDPFEPGSTFKPFLISAALEEDVVKPETVVYCENGTMNVGGKTIHDHKPYGSLSISRILQYSSNICSAKIGLKLGKKKFYEYISNFGFGGQSNVDLPGESRGILSAPKRWSSLDLATISFGQGVSVTALQLLAAFSALANGGVLMQPRIVAGILGGDGSIKEKMEPREVRRVISPETAKLVTKMLATVAEDGGTGRLAWVDRFPVAGKTGTAQKALSGGRGYSKDRYIASFVGYVPAENPAFTILVSVDEPHGSEFGGIVAAPVFGEIARRALAVRGILPQGEDRIAEIIDRERAEREAEAKAATPVALPDASAAAGVSLEDVVKVAVRPVVKVEPKKTAIVDAPGKMPDLRGLDLRAAIVKAGSLGLKINVSGGGFVYRQKPEPGGAIKAGDSCYMELRMARDS